MDQAPPRSELVAPRRRLLALAIGALLVGACGAGPGPELVEFTPTATPAPTPTAEPTATPQPEPTAIVETSTPEPTPEPAVMIWTVVDTVASLNMRAEPTTSAQIVTILEPGQSGLVGTGETATADGLEWVELAAAGDRPSGWVALEFVVLEGQ